MSAKQNILSFLKENKGLFLSKFHITKIGLFGSFARDEEKADSDIDILIAREPGAKNIYDLDWELRDLLKKQFNRDIDICTEKYIKPYCRQYVLRDAIYV